MISLTIIGGLFLAYVIFVIFFTPRINYHIPGPLDAHSDEFLHTLLSTCQVGLHLQNRVDVLTDGTSFYPAILDAISRARSSVTLENYIFRPGTIGDRFIDALTERARAGIPVRITVDAVGSVRLRGDPLGRLLKAGCQVVKYQGVKWYTLARLNNRTHRELFIIDGKVAFTGGAGIADWWIRKTDKGSAWRDTIARIEGPIVATLQGVFAENWLESCGEIITGRSLFPQLEPAGSTPALLVKSSPSDRVTTERVAFQMLIQGARKVLQISTPYFLPDQTLREAFVETARRGVRIQVIVPGRRTDQRWVRVASRRMWGTMLAAGVQIYEYEPAMTHAKVLIVDDLWSILGTTNLDNRSFEHNDEVNIAMRDPAIARRLREDFERDLGSSKLMTYAAWKERPLWERTLDLFAWILERQQ